MIAGGADTPLEALKAVRALSAATIVMKRGPMGCVVFPGAIPDDIEQGLKGPGFPVEVYNVLGAGDAFMAGFLRGWLRDEPIETCCAFANAGGAFAVSRLLCSAEYLTWPELQRFLKVGSPYRALRHDATFNHIHWATTRRAQPDSLMALAIDHRAQLEAIADEAGAPHDRLPRLKLLAVEAAARVADGRPGFGMLRTEIDGETVPAPALECSPASGRSSATATSPASARRCTARATFCRPFAPTTSRRWRIAAVAFAKASDAARMMACTTSIGPGATNMVTAAASRTSTGCRCCCCPATSSPAAVPIRCCSRSRISPTARSAPTTAFRPGVALFRPHHRPEQI
jgi:hypothetical protein